MLVQVKAMKNPRSALCKTAIMAASDIFKSYGDKLLDDTSSDALDQMVYKLINWIYDFLLLSIVVNPISLYVNWCFIKFAAPTAVAQGFSRQKVCM